MANAAAPTTSQATANYCYNDRENGLADSFSFISATQVARTYSLSTIQDFVER